MADIGAGHDLVPRGDIAEQGQQRIDLYGGEFAIAEFMARIDQLDADRTRVDVADATTGGHAGMQGALPLLDQPVDGAVLAEDVMGPDLGNGKRNRGVTGKRG